VEAYLRLDTEKILVRCNVYTPDHVVVQDVKLLENVPVTGGLKAGGWILINTAAQPENLEIFSGFRLAWVDATAIAIQNQLGTRTHPIINTAIIGAFARILKISPIQIRQNQRDSSSKYTLTVQHMKISKTEISGRTRVIPDGNKTKTIDAPNIFFAIGAEADALWHFPATDGTQSLSLSHCKLIEQKIPPKRISWKPWPPIAFPTPPPPASVIRKT
jgi:2-oxoacid:acceptor oxidoreductase gamma subunit (pyruvate/2-ketoisovalerate family)